MEFYRLGLWAIYHSNLVRDHLHFITGLGWKANHFQGLRGSEWVKLYLFEHTSQNLEPEIFFITKTVSLSLNDADLIIQPLHKT